MKTFQRMRNESAGLVRIRALALREIGTLGRAQNAAMLSVMEVAVEAGLFPPARLTAARESCERMRVVLEAVERTAEEV